MQERQDLAAAREALQWPLPPEIQRLQGRALIVGAIALAVCVVGGLFAPEQFFRTYLAAFMLVLGLTLGSLAILMIQHLTGGAWGLVIRRILEAATRTLPLMTLLFLPLLLGLTVLYPWARPEAVAADEVLQHRQPYLNTAFFLIRAVVYFGAWLALAHILNRWSLEQDRTSPPPPDRKFRLLSAPGLVVYGLTITFASVDWVMAVDPHWFSTMFGVLTMGGQGLSGLALAIIVLYLLSSSRPMANALSRTHFHDLGKLLLAFVMLWAYFAFSQFLIIWSANLPEVIPWYLYRTGGGWQWIAGLLALGHFAVPFLLLLSRETKRDARLLAAIAGGLLAMRYVDLFWLIAPEFHHEGFRLQWMDILLPVGLGGIWIAAFVRQLGTRPLLPVNDPALEDVFVHAGH